MVRNLALVLLLSTPAAAETYISDAFGILPEGTISNERAAWSGLRDGSVTRKVQSDKADAVLIFIGPKALVAGKDKGHAMALAFDRHGNLVQDARAVFSLESNDILETNVRDGIADVLFLPEPKADTFAGGASIDGLQSPRALYRVTADLESVTPAFKGTQIVKSETFGTVESVDLADQYGNLVEDGVGTSVVLSHNGGTYTLLAAPIRESKAEAVILGRDMLAGGTTTLHIGSASSSEAFEYQHQVASGSPDLTVWALEEIGAIGLRLGPVATEAGHLLTDGSPVVIRVFGDGGNEVQSDGWIRDGFFETVVRRPSVDDKLTVTFQTALGFEPRSIEVGVAAPDVVRGAE